LVKTIVNDALLIGRGIQIRIPFKLMISLNHRWTIKSLINGKGLSEKRVTTNLMSEKSFQIERGKRRGEGSALGFAVLYGGGILLRACATFCAGKRCVRCDDGTEMGDRVGLPATATTPWSFQMAYKNRFQNEQG